MTVALGRIPVHRVNLGAGILAFFTQSGGGFSPSPWESLNLGSNVHDAPDRVAQNRRVVEEYVGKPIRFADQIHSSRVLDLDLDLSELASANSVMSVGEADGLVSASKDYGLGILVADCVPILLADPSTGVIGGAHAGRAGLMGNIIANTVTAMVSRGANLASMTAAVGPCICASCYEVPADMARAFEVCTGLGPTQTRWGTTGLDLRAATQRQLTAAGVNRVVDVPQCTLETTELFSHRRATKAGQVAGRMAGVISLTDNQRSVSRA